jgi:SAM-dependent methyltransferase
MTPEIILSIPRRALNVVRGVVQRYGPPAVKRRLWDWEFHHGRWTCLDETPDDPAYPYLARYANGGRILDLGCGPGNVGRHLEPTAYTSYVGVDISQVAIDRAREKDRRPHNTYVQSDVLAYRPEGAYDVILLGDSLYYIPRAEALGMLRRYRQHLTEAGVFIVKMHNTPSFQPFFQLIRDHFCVLAERSHRPVVLVVFRVIAMLAIFGWGP